jgi:hypothetical protein
MSNSFIILALIGVLGMMGCAFLARLSDAGAGSINGEVKFNDAPPKLAAIKVTNDQDYCGVERAVVWNEKS